MDPKMIQIEAGAVGDKGKVAGPVLVKAQIAMAVEEVSLDNQEGWESWHQARMSCHFHSIH